MSSHKPPVAVVGAGIAGLIAARELRRREVPVVVYEAGKQIAGLARSFRDEQGFAYDFAPHFITNRLASAIGVLGQCRDVSYYGESVRIGRSTYSYPFGLLRVPRFAAGGVVARLRPGGGAPVGSAAEHFRQHYGAAFADEVAIPLLEAWSGAPAAELAPSVAAKIQNGIAYTMLLKVIGRMRQRAVAIGYSHEMPEGPHVWHVYPNGGVGLLSDHLAAELGGAVHLESPVEAIVVEDDRVVSVSVAGREESVSAVVSTAPVHILPRLVRGTTALQHLARFRFRPMVFVNLRLEGRHLLSDTVLWTPEVGHPFFRLTETPRSMPWLAPSGKTLLTVDIGCEVGDDIWRTPDAELADLCLTHLEPLIPGVRRRYLGYNVLRTPIAYPVFLNEYEDDRRRFEISTGVRGLYSIGRNGEFAHLLMEDVYWRTLRRVDQMLAEMRLGPERERPAA